MQIFAQSEILTYITYATALIGPLIIALFALPRRGLFTRLFLGAVASASAVSMLIHVDGQLQDARLEKARFEIVLAGQEEEREFREILLAEIKRGGELNLELLAKFEQRTLEDVLSEETRARLSDAQYAELKAEFEKLSQEVREAQQESIKLAQAEQLQAEERRFARVKRLADPELNEAEISASADEDTTRAEALEAQIEETRQELAAVRQSNETLARRVENSQSSRDWQAMDVYTPAISNGGMVVNVENTDLLSREDVNALVQDVLEENGVESVFGDSSPFSETESSITEARLEAPALGEISDVQNARLEEMSASLSDNLDEQRSDLSERMAELTERQVDLDVDGTSAIEEIRTEAGVSFDGLISDVNSVEDYQSDYVSDERSSQVQSQLSPQVFDSMQPAGSQSMMRYNPETGVFSDSDTDDMYNGYVDNGYVGTNTTLLPNGMLRSWDDDNGILSDDYGFQDTLNPGLNNDFVGSMQDWNSGFRNDLGLPNSGSFEFSNTGMPSSVQNWSGNVSGGQPD